MSDPDHSAIARLVDMFLPVVLRGGTFPGKLGDGKIGIRGTVKRFQYKVSRKLFGEFRLDPAVDGGK